MTVAEPFERGVARASLRRIAADFGADFIHADAIGVSSDATRVAFAGGESMRADTVIVAVGARPVAAFEDAITFGLPARAKPCASSWPILNMGPSGDVAFVAPSLACWSLPLYELALMTARMVAAAGADGVRLSLVTPEARPLAVFGGEPSAAAERLRGGDRVRRRHPRGRPARRGLRPPDGALLRGRPGGRAAVCIVPASRACPARLPRVRARRSSRPRCGPQRRLRRRQRHRLPAKQGGIAAAQADAVAEHVAARHGAAVEAEPFQPVLRGMLLTGDAPTFVRSDRGDPDRGAVATWHPLWWPPTKIAGRHLAPYLHGRDLPAPIRPTAGFIDVDVPLTAVTLPG